MANEERARQLEPRLRRFDRLFDLYPTGRAQTDFWVGFPARMRFKVGSSPRDWQVPYAFTLAVENLAAAAIADLAVLLGQRARERVQTVRGRDITLEVDVRELRDASERVTVRPISFAMRTFKPGSLEYRITDMCVGRDSRLDAALLDVWFSRGGMGGELVRTLKALYSKSIEHELKGAAAGAVREPLTFVTHLAMLQLLRSKMAVLKDASSRLLPYEALDRAVGTVLACALRVAAASAVSEFRQRGVKADLTSVELATGLSSAPLVLMSSGRAVDGSAEPSPLLRDSANWYGLGRNVVTLLDGAYQVVGDDSDHIPGKIDALLKHAKGEPALFEACVSVGEMLTLREHTLGYLSRHDSPTDPRNRDLSDPVFEHSDIASLARNAKQVDAAVAAIDSLSRSAEGEKAVRLAGLRDLFVRLKKKGRSSGAFDLDGLVRDVAERYMLLRLDLTADHHVTNALQFTVDRSRQWEDQEFVDRYEAGRVYRLGDDARAVRMERTDIREGHLFLDMKGYTKRTVVDQALNVAEFMREHFFGPVLLAAQNYTDRDKRPLLKLNNLLGDAITFSGDIVSLVSLSDDLERIFKVYEDKLAGRDVGDAENEARRELDAEYQTLGALLGRALLDCESEMAQRRADGDADALAGLQKNREEVVRRMAQLNAYYEERSRRLESNRIEVGLFISYGSAAEVVKVQDKVYGIQNIAVAEKINESARGTARNEAVRAKVDAARAQQGSAALPFDVYVERTFRVVLPPALSTALTKSLMGTGSADEVAAQIGQRIQAELGRGLATDHGQQRLLQPHNDIYNLGRALSSEAVRAFLTATTTTRAAIRVSLRVADLSSDLRERFFFSAETLDLIVSYPLAEPSGGSRATPIVLRYAGELVFRGFEALRATQIFEMLKPASPFYQAIGLHFQSWKQALREGKIPLVTTI